MPVITAQIFAGSAHPNEDGGILEGFQFIQLFEGSKPYWQMSIDPSKGTKFTWIPEKVDSILADGILMAFLHVFHAAETESLAKREPQLNSPGRLFLNENLPPEYLQDLRSSYKSNKEITNPNRKIILCVFRGSSIVNQVSLMRDIDATCEVLQPAYSRLYSPWSDDITTAGQL